MDWWKNWGRRKWRRDVQWVGDNINGKELNMEVDTGAAVSILSEKTFRKIFPNAVLKPAAVTLRTYTGQRMSVVGQLTVLVKYQSQSHSLPLLIVAGDGPSLFGRDWLRHITLDWKTIGLASMDQPNVQLNSLLQAYDDVFADEHGEMRHFKADLKLKDPTSSPIFKKPRPVPFALKEAVGIELDRLEDQGTLTKVNHSEWAAPIVVVPKGDGQIRICGDYKVTVNPVLAVDQYPLPKPEDLFTALSGGKRFTKLDLRHAYQQMRLEDSAKELVTINTHKGLYQYNRLPFGMASAPAIFQRTMDVILQGLEGVICYIDDILITGSSDKKHLANLEEVLKRLKHHGIKLKTSKCKFLEDEVEFLGHRLSGSGVSTSSKKVEAVQLAPVPTNVQQLRSFLGMVNYYGKFIPNLSSILHPLNALLKQNQKWKWTRDCQRSFETAKESLAQAPVLAHYDTALPLRLAGDASAFGLGVVLSHLFPDGTERPVAYASRTLSTSEQNYSQLEKEALSLVYGVKKFHSYLYGRTFELLTDHKPLTTILGPKTGIPSIAAARLQRWALLLSCYQYQIKFKSTQSHANADCLSRLPLSLSDSSESSDVLPSSTSVFNINQISAMPISSIQVAEATRRDPTLSRVLLYTKQGWPSHIEPGLRPYCDRRLELTIEQDCLLWGIRVVVPPKFTEQVLQELHQSHPGIVRMKSVARSYVWWPQINEDIEHLVKKCEKCQSTQSAPPLAPLHPWLWPTKPWERIHVDFAGPVRGKMLFVVVDAHSKWPEVFPMVSTTASATIRVLRSLFATYGLLRQVVSDNGPQFASEEFRLFLGSNRVKHIKSSPYHPSTNGAAERFIRTLKRALKGGDDLHMDLTTFLMSYRISPHATTSTPPCELFLKRTIRTRLDMIRPDLGSTISDKQSAQKAYHDVHSRVRDFFLGQRVLARNYREGPRWISGVIAEKRGPLTYLVQIRDDVLWKRHVDQIINATDTPDDVSPRSHTTDTPDVVTPVHIPPESSPAPVLPAPSSSIIEPPSTPQPVEIQEESLPQEPEPTTQPTQPPLPVQLNPQTPPRRYPLRQNRRPPKRFGFPVQSS